MEQAPSASPRARFRMERAASGFQLSPVEIALLAGILAICAAAAYFAYAKTTDLNASPAAGVASAYIPAFRTNLSTTVATNGNVQATQQVNLSFGSAGEIKEINVKVGDQVTTGQNLARLDDTQLQASLRSAQSNLASAEARLDAVIHPSAASVASAQASVTTAQNQVNTAQQALSDLRAGPKASDIATAQQGVLSAQTGLQNAQDGLKKAQAAVGTAQSDVNTATSDLDDTFSKLGQAHDALVAAKSNANCTGAPATPVVPRKGSRADGAPFVSATLVCAGPGTLATYQAAATAYGGAASSYNGAVTNLAAKQTALDNAQDALSSGNLDRALQSAQLGLQTALQKQTDTLAGATPAQLAQAQAAIDTANASLLSAQERYTELVNPTPETVLPLQSSVDQAASSLETARQNADKATITAPFDGVISAVNGTVGNQASASTGTGANAGVITLLNPRLIRVDASADQTVVSKLKAGQTARITFDALSGFTYTATVSSVGLTPTTSSGVVTYRRLVRHRHVNAAGYDSRAVARHDGAGHGHDAAGQRRARRADALDQRHGCSAHR